MTNWGKKEKSKICENGEKGEMLEMEKNENIIICRKLQDWKKKQENGIMQKTGKKMQSCENQKNAKMQKTGKICKNGRRGEI